MSAEPVMRVMLAMVERIRARVAAETELNTRGHDELAAKIPIDERGGDSSRYRAGLDDLARLASDIDVSGVFWH